MIVGGAETASIANGEITPDFVQGLLKPALEGNPKCRNIFFFNNFIDKEGYEALVELLAENLTIRMFGWFRNHSLSSTVRSLSFHNEFNLPSF